VELKKSFPEDRREAFEPHRGAKMAAPCSIYDLRGLLRCSGANCCVATPALWSGGTLQRPYSCGIRAPVASPQ
jgi:hypothetical protein